MVSCVPTLKVSKLSSDSWQNWGLSAVKGCTTDIGEHVSVLCEVPCVHQHTLLLF